MPAADTACRLYVDQPLGAGLTLALNPEASHYLLNVLRLKPGTALAVFNGRDGEWLAEIAGAARKSCALGLVRQLKPQTASPDLWLAFAPVKRARIDYIAAKATELGVSRLWPVLTRRTDVGRVNTGRLLANAIEAAEQCERLDVPEVSEPVPLADLVARWPAGRRLIVCEERGLAPPAAQALAAAAREGGGHPWAALVGPEGGFAPEEMAMLKALPGAVMVSLGPRILRAETAALAVLVLWQAILGDWGGVETSH